METLDMTGKICPIPMVEAKKALAAPETQALRVQVDNEIAVQNLKKMAAALGYAVPHTAQSGVVFTVTIQKEAGDGRGASQEQGARGDATQEPGGASHPAALLAPAARDTNAAPPADNRASTDEKQEKKPGSATQKKSLVVVIGSDALGSGEAALGAILMKGFLYALSELEPVPDAVVFMNRGATLTAAGAGAIGDLKKLENKGATLLTCGTCIDYYNLPNPPAVGVVANMYEIVETMARADSVVNL